jgi:hypothetical protein
MHIEGKMHVREDVHNGIFIEADIIGDSSCDELVIDALRSTNRSYQPTVTWDENKSCYHLEAQWDADPDWGDDFTAIIQRLGRVVPPELISMRLERPNEPVAEWKALIDMQT